MSTHSDSPETDANCYFASTFANAPTDTPLVHADFARSLERQRNEARKALIMMVADERIRQEKQWLPIESAPRDGTVILGYFSPEHIELIQFSGRWSYAYDGDAPSEHHQPSHWTLRPPQPGA